ncbi:MAG: potassium transporter KtrB, partial [Chlamydiae bacterium]|nr:potassium transporter KtrB [Chlamydiota bacterium]
MIKNAIKVFSRIHPAKMILIGYLSHVLVGWLVLLLPICQNLGVSLLDNFFIAMSALSTTGLTTVDVGKEYSMIGQIVILLLIQAGGIGYMTFNTFIVLATTRKLSLFRQMITSTAFSLPRNFVISEFIFHVIIFTFVCELIGAAVLSYLFMNNGIENFIWYGIFHSISAFCTAGFSLFPDSLMGFQDNLGINLVFSTLSILGAIGFISWLDFYKKITGKKEYLTFTTKVILFVTFWFLILGSFLFLLTENVFSEGSIYHKVITAFFQVMTASTTVGFNTLDIGGLSVATIILLIFLMVFGASPSGTGGGLKSTTFVALVGLVKSTLKGQNHVSFWKREIPDKRLQLATAIFSYYILVMTISVFFLVIVESKPLLPLVFEAASALGTVGLSMGITSSLTEVGKILIALLMFMGKMGILTFGIALASKMKEES